MTPEQEIIRANDARHVLEHYLYRESFQKVREGLVESISRSPLGDAETHHRLAIALQVLGQLEKSLKSVMETGQLAEIQVKDKKRFFG